MIKYVSYKNRSWWLVGQILTSAEKKIIYKAQEDNILCLADSLSKLTYIAFQGIQFYQLHSMWIIPMTLPLLEPCSTLWAADIFL